MREPGFLCSCVLVSLLISCASAVDCPPGFRWDRMSGVGCVQADCPDVAAPNSHWGYTGNCICGTDDCVGNPVCVECYGPVDYSGFDRSKCGIFCPNVKLIACVKPDAPCPGEKTSSTSLKATTTTAKATTTTKSTKASTTTLPENEAAELANLSSRLTDAFNQNFDEPQNSIVTRAGLGGEIEDWLREGWRRLVPQDIISIDDTDAWREWRIVGSDGSFVDVKIGGGTFKVSREGIEIKVKGLIVDTSSGGGYVKGFTIGDVGIEQSFKPEDIAKDKIKEKLTEDMPGIEPISPDIDWDGIQRDIADWFRNLKDEAYNALPDGLKEADEMTKHLRGGN